MLMKGSYEVVVRGEQAGYASRPWPRHESDSRFPCCHRQLVISKGSMGSCHRASGRHRHTLRVRYKVMRKLCG